MDGMYTEDEFLEQSGVKGMKWGVRKEDVLVGRDTGSNTEVASKEQVKAFSEQSVRIKSELKKLGHTELDSAVLKAKYETPAGEEPTKGLSDKQKLALKIGAGVVVGGALAYALYKANGLGNDLGKLDATKTTAYFGAVDGLKINWDTPVKLPKGSVIKRISTIAEKDIRPGGFFGCFRDEDVQSYSAILPTFWQQWGVGSPLSGGFINHYKAGAAVAAPSGKETLEVFKSLVDSSSEFRANLGMRHFNPAEYPNVKEYAGMFEDFTKTWIKDDTPNNKMFFSAIKDKGYNALIDFNDAGKLGKTPLRVIDSSIFTIVKNEPLKLKDMVAAAKDWSPSLVHMLFTLQTTRGMMEGMYTEDEFLEQSGVKGMKWGVTRELAAGGNKKATKLLAKEDSKWIKEQHSVAGFVKINNHVADKMNNGGIAEFNANPKYKKIKNYLDDSDPKVKEYYDDYAKVSAKAWTESIKEVYGVESPSGRYKFTAQKTADGRDYLDIEDTSLAHADTPPTRLYLNVDATTGVILGIKTVDDTGEIKHSNTERGYRMDPKFQGEMLTEEEFLMHMDYTGDMSDDEFFEHYGKKGMKWGQRMAEYNLGAVAKSRNVRTESGSGGKQEKGVRNAAIDAARGRVADGSNKANLKNAKADYKASKRTEGKAAAKSALRAVKDKNADDLHDSKLAKGGKEAVAAIITSVVAGIAVGYISSRS